MAKTKTNWESHKKIGSLLRELAKGGKDPPQRKARLYGVAICMAVQDKLDPKGKKGMAAKIIEASRQFADGRISVREREKELFELRQEIGWTYQDGPGPIEILLGPVVSMSEISSKIGGLGMKEADQCIIVRDIFMNPSKPYIKACLQCRTRWPNNADCDCEASKEFHSWLKSNSGVVPRLACGIYDDDRMSDIGVVADALEDAGCTDAALLGHMRNACQHVRGCWAIDCLLGREMS